MSGGLKMLLMSTLHHVVKEIKIKQESPTEFWRFFGAAEKNKEKVKANCTGFSAEFFGSQSEEMFCFDRKKNQMLTTSSRSLTRIHQRLLKSLGIHI